jgi:hypothetical protein
MAIQVEHEGMGVGGPYEQCCFCRTCTPMWTVMPDRNPEQQVACCEACAVYRQPSEVPTKAAWCETEAALTAPRFGWGS